MRKGDRGKRSRCKRRGGREAKERDRKRKTNARVKINESLKQEKPRQREETKHCSSIDIQLFNIFTAKSDWNKMWEERNDREWKKITEESEVRRKSAEERRGRGQEGGTDEECLTFLLSI